MKRDDILIGVGAGLVSAVLFATVIRGSLAAFLLFYLTPLPVAIVALGWQHRSGLVASLVGTLVVGLVFDPLFGAIFALAFALPAWFLSYLALLARHVQAVPATGGAAALPPGADKQWYPLGGLALWTAGLSVLLTFGGALSLGPDYEAYRTSVQDLMLSALKGGLEELPNIGPQTPSLTDLARLLATVVVPSSAAASALVTLIILLIAAKLVSLSGRLPRPLPRIAREFVLPRITFLGFVVTAVLAVIPGWSRFLAIALAASLTLLLALQGLATAHILVARFPARPIILGIGYAMLVIAEPWMLIGLAFLGLAEMILSLRARSLATPPRQKLD